MNDIFSSKLFKASSRQAEIRAAAQNPINSELVKQLRKYLDPEYRKSEYLGESPETESSDRAEPEVIVDESPDTTPPTPDFKPPRTSGVSQDSYADLADADAEAEEVTDVDIEDEAEDDSESTDESGSVENAVQIPKGAVSISAAACTGDCVDPDVIRGTLNSREDCAGVVRISVKNDSELWIYYNDNINLNTIMEPVISLLEKTGYSRLVFNRLARTDNAIVFEIMIIPQQIGQPKEVK